MAIIAEAGSAVEAIHSAGARLDVAVVDYHLGDRSGLWVARRLARSQPRPRVLLYSAVSGLLDRLVYLSLGLALVLAFIGVKLILEFLHGQARGVPEISTGASLAVIVVVLGATTVASLLRTRRSSRGSADSTRPAPAPL